MSGPSQVATDPLDRAEYLAVLGYAPADVVTAFVADITPALGTVDVISVQTGLLSFEEASRADDSPGHSAGDVLVTEAHILLNDMIDGYSAIFGTDTLHAVAVAVLDAALHGAVHSAEQAAPRERIERFIDEQAALLAQEEERPFPEADLLPA